MLKVDGLTKIYGRGRLAVKALDNISIEFPDKGLVVILGKSGCGKSTLMNMLGGLDQPTRGDVVIDGKRLGSFSAGKLNDYRNTYIGFVFQNFNIIENRTVYENIELALKLQNNESDVTFIDDVLMTVGLGGLGYRKPSELSGGQRQRVAIARALVKNPEIILADEPTGAVDSHTGDDLFVLLKKLSKTKLVIVVTHDNEVAYRYGDRIISLEDGHIVGDVDRKKRLDDAETRKLRDNILFVKAGHAFTHEDVVELVDKKRDNYLTFEQDKQHVILAYPDVIDKVDTGYAAGDFAPHEPPPETPERKTKLRRARMGLGNCIREAFANLKKRRRKVVTMTVIATLCMVFFYIALSFVTVNLGRVFAESSHKYGADFMSVGNQDRWSGDFDPAPALTTLNGYSAGLKYTMPITHYPVNNTQNYSSSFEDRIAGFITVKDFADYGLALDCGEFPDAPNEILVSDYFAEQLISTGYIRSEDGVLSLYKPASREELVGTGLYVSNSKNVGAIVISGVYATNFEKVQELSEGSDEYGSYFSTSAKNYYLFIVVGEDFRDYYVESLARIPYTAMSILAGDYVDGPRYTEYTSVSKDDIFVSIAGFNPKSALADGDVVVSVALATQLYYAKFGYTDVLMTDKMLREVLTEFDFIPSSSGKYSNTAGAMKINIVAIVYGEGDNELRANVNTFREISDRTCVPTELIYTTANKDLRVFSDTAEAGELYVENALFGSSVANFVLMLSDTTNVLFVIAGVLAFFVLITVLNFLIVMTKERRKENGIMRALGASSGETIRVFNIELSFIVAIVVCISAVISALVLSGVNSSLFTFIEQPIVLVRLGLVEFGIGFAAFALFVFLCSAPILLRQAGRAPIDVINDI